MLILVPTPIGNLVDISLRALEVLKSADLILCEDTRHTGRLLTHYGITSPVEKAAPSPHPSPKGRGEALKKVPSPHPHENRRIPCSAVAKPRLRRGERPLAEWGEGRVRGKSERPWLVSLHEHNEQAQIPFILQALREGKSVALVSDAGTPLVSDPGYKLVREAIREGLPVTALPGANAAVTALVLSGLPPDAFSFYGFLPKKSSQRKRFFQTLKAREETLIFYESPYRVLKTLEDMLAVFGDRDAAVCREISKKFEETLRGKLSELAAAFGKRRVIGEFVIVVGGNK